LNRLAMSGGGKNMLRNWKIPPAAQHLLSFRPAELAAGERTHTASFC